MRLEVGGVDHHLVRLARLARDDSITFDPATDTLGVDGGTGTDTLFVLGAGIDIDLTATSDTVFSGFERIDISGAGITNAGNTLVVAGGEDDAVVAGGGWIDRGLVTIGAQDFRHYTQGVAPGAARLLVDDDIDQTGIDSSKPIFLSDVANGSGGFKITGEYSGDQAGFSVSSAGDVNGDGFADLIVGAYRNDVGGEQLGSAYVMFGGDFLDQVDFLGGAGNDTIVFDPADTLRIDGGSGSDTLQFAGSGEALDLTSLSGLLYTGFEEIDLTGTGNNTLTLDEIDVLNITDGVNGLAASSTPSLANDANVLIVTGDSGDMVNFTDFTDLGEDADVTIGGRSYSVFDGDTTNATLLVDNAILAPQV